MPHKIYSKRRNARVKPSRSLPLARAVQGIILSFGAPIGWVITQLIAGRSPFASENLDHLLYGYMSIATAFIFGLIGWFIGRREAFITRLALRDSLTGLYNKRFFYSKLTVDFDQFVRDGKELSIVLLDLDYFKKVNDTYGHPAGDEVLRQVAALLQNHCRRNDVAARTGGEEFCIIMGNSNKDDSAKSAERIRAAIEATEIKWQDKSIRVTASFGVSECDATTKDIDDLIERADRALYRAKDSGRNQVCSNIL